MFPGLTKMLSLAFSQTLFKLGCSNFAYYITLLGVYQFIPGLMTLTRLGWGGGFEGGKI